jgi:polar amino acid transport system substrate-binding protein
MATWLHYSLITAAALAMAASTQAIAAGNECTAGNTLTEDRLTVATGNPAYPPWVMNDAPESGEGFEAAVAYAVAEQMGFEKSAVDWVRTSFDEAIQPGAKNFDFNLQQYSIKPERLEVIDFSAPYYTTTMAVVVKDGTDAAATEPVASSLKQLKFGAAAGTTSQPFLAEVLKPEQDMLLYDDNADVVAALAANQIDAIVFDLPSALFVTAVQLDGGKLLGQFPVENNESPDNFGLLMAKGSALKPCVDAAIEALSADGTLQQIESQWLADGAGVPVIDMDK